MHREEQLTSFLSKGKFARLYEQNLSTMQNNNTFPISIETLETHLNFIKIEAYLRGFVQDQTDR